ncbi:MULTISPECIES: cysteine--tRNA ligase [Desulfococcus]|jgi:cysteinyl-tRNA synthetase|uniref:Cysteine--tRNA ligase n=1 Tax=Desulfococcus multivorans DSM 2059 TaxID=1121405 RepID=S7U2T9_DESML|nr:cysteine--tRNA ligase [Desulfococcus multivorans]AOY59012.1 CysS2: cysteinyl-tRNA synthetase [Desulfococcus multivorans]AQV01274.1 cysteine--tRNA ligase [Desulfococcus multivorans]EPR43761.1 Cysteinyl-tRNA synthetase [Desulfococcus multivorans DSM 2059]MDX9818013.1 cysteine--tRNA ligase [Desulfococcus multivorans]SJZ55459.1 cysteinyl-tRNA synthetase [Desulfococcus multivorans DSM 2059]
MKLYLYNTLTRKKEEFQPLFPDYVGLYTCGPTVYNHAHIGNLRTYIFEDVLKRTLRFNGFTVRHVMNITDVGHLTGDRDMGEDKLERGAAREGRSAWDIAEMYTRAFKEDMARLNLLPPDIWCKATETIPEQIALIETLAAKGYTYTTSDGIYFDTSRFKDYTKLSHQNLEALQEGARVERNPEKRNPTDFALWKFSPRDEQRQMEWPSPWGVGFPGWHIECSAMSMKFLGDHLDIHCGGTDHIDVHHTNEIAQSEAATGKPFFRFWVHGAFLNIAGGKKMAKSAGNFLTLQHTFIDRGIDPLAYRYAAFQTHYRNPMEYSDETVQAAVNGLDHLRNQVRHIKDACAGSPADIPAHAADEARTRFLAALNDDLNMPRAMAVVQEILKSDMPPTWKLALVLELDAVLGFGLDRVGEAQPLPADIREKAAAREAARRERNWALSDQLRDEIQALGYVVQDGKDGMKVFPK